MMRCALGNALRNAQVDVKFRCKKLCLLLGLAVHLELFPVKAVKADLAAASSPRLSFRIIRIRGRRRGQIWARHGRLVEGKALAKEGTQSFSAGERVFRFTCSEEPQRQLPASL